MFTFFLGRSYYLCIDPMSSFGSKLPDLKRKCKWEKRIRLPGKGKARDYV
jgi:hypothetical protein